MTPQAAPGPTYIAHYDAIVKTMNAYVDGVREGKSELMRPVFHPAATFERSRWRGGRCASAKVEAVVF